MEMLLPMHPSMDRRMVVDWAQQAEQLRAARLWVAELRSADPFSLAIVLQHAAPTLATGTCIASLYARSVRAIAAATAVLADGHDFILGVGVSNQAIASWHERVWESPQQTVPAKVARLRRLLAGNNDDRGPSMFWRRSEQDHVPIHMAGVSARGVGLASACADGLLLNLVPPGDQLDLTLERFRQDEGEGAGRPVRCVVRMTPHTSSPSDAWQAWLEDEIRNYAAAPGYREVFASGSREVQPSQLARGAEQWASLKAEYESAGVTPVALPFLAPWEDPAEVVPAVIDAVAEAR